MKLIIYLTGLLAMLATSGCVIREEDHYRGGGYDHHYYDHGRDHYAPYPYQYNWDYRHP